MATSLDGTGAQPSSAQYFSDPILDPDIPNYPPSTHHTNAVGGTFPESYHTTSHPVSHKLNSEEITVYENNPPKMVGNLFLPGTGENLWEVVEVSFSKKGWSSLVVQEEGSGKLHKMLMEDFMGMLMNGVLKGVDY